jgi:hypothetical protein
MYGLKPVPSNKLRLLILRMFTASLSNDNSTEAGLTGPLQC